MERDAYVVITPARDEAANLPRLAESLAEQTIRPTTWVVVDNGSTDATPALVADLAQRYPWVVSLAVAGESRPRPGAPVVRAFHAGLDAIDPLPPVVVKLDADVALPPTYFADLLHEFAVDASLGIAGGYCLELEEGMWKPVRNGAAHVRGAVRAYRRECLLEILPLPERTGWDTADELRAGTRGWATRVIPSLHFEHHRALGARDGGPTRRWRAKGEAAHYLDYRPLYLVLRSLYWARRDPAAVTMIWGFVEAALRRRVRLDDAAARVRLREAQRLRHLMNRPRNEGGKAL